MCPEARHIKGILSSGDTTHKNSGKKKGIIWNF